jgi:hypothetical protein
LHPGAKLTNLAGALKETLPHLPADKPLAVVCAGQTCWSPTSDPELLRALLSKEEHSAAVG